MNDNIATTIETLVDKAWDFSSTTTELIKLKATDKVAAAVSSLAVRTILFFIVAMFILIFSIALALWAGEKLGKSYYGFLSVGGVYVIMAILIYSFRDKWIGQPVSNAIIKKILQ